MVRRCALVSAVFPLSIPFYPSASADIRFGTHYFDLGLAGMYFPGGNLWGALGEGGNLMYWTVGADVRWNLQMVIKKLRELKLDLFVLGGYYFASLNMSYGAEWQQTVVGQVRDFKEEVFLDFRSSSYFLGLQISKEVVDIGIFKLVPYVGFRAIIADSDSDYEWETRREATLTVDGQKYLYPRGIRYKSAGVDSDLAFYAQIYGGAEVTLGFIPVTIGIAYDPASSNFSVNVSARFSTARH